MSTIPPGTPAPYAGPPAGPAPRRTGNSCWLVGILTCFVVFVIAAILIGLSIYGLSRTKSGKTLARGFGQAMHTAEEAGLCTQKLLAIHSAIVRYHDHTGSYPASLSSLVPDYLPGQDPLHCSMTGGDPSKPTFEYIRPGSNARPDDPLVRFKAAIRLAIGNQTQVSETTCTVSIAGHMTTRQFTTSVTSSSVPASTSP